MILISDLNSSLFRLYNFLRYYTSWIEVTIMEAVADGAEASSIDVEDDESSFGIRDDWDSWDSTNVATWMGGSLILIAKTTYKGDLSRGR